MVTEDQPKEVKRLVTRNDWIGCSLVAVVLTLVVTFGNAKNHSGADPAGVLGSFIGSV